MPFHKDNVRINLKHELGASTTSSPGDLYQRFRPYFDILLSPENPRRLGLSFEKAYVRVPEIENSIEEHLNSTVGNLIIVAGNRGVGKSTVLRKIIGDLSVPSISQRRLSIPFLLESNRLKLDSDSQKLHETIVDTITSQLDAASETLSESIGGFVHNDEAFFRFIKTHSPRLLRDRKLKESANFRERLDFLKEKNPYAYFAEIIKYRIRETGLNRIVFIVDNIEHVDSEIQCSLIENLVSLRNCFYNTPDEDLNYVVDVLITCRPESLDYFQHNGNIKGWTPPKKVTIKAPVDLDQIILRRFQSAIDTIGSGMKGTGGHFELVSDTASWQHAYDELIKILAAMSDRHGKIIVELANYDLRQSMDFLLNSLKNSRWYFRGNRSDEGAFDDIKEADYRFSYAGFFRSLVLRDVDMFMGIENAVLGNVLHNTSDEPDADLMCVYTAIYMQKRGLRRAIAIEQISSALSIGFDKTAIDQCLDDRLQALETSGLIYPDRIVYERKFRNQEGFLATERLNAVLVGIKNSSLFLEFFRDDIWARKSVIGELIPTSHLDGRSKFLATARMIDDIFRVERKIFERVQKNGSPAEFERAFGRRRFSALCLDGLIASLRKYYKDRDTGKINIPTSINNKVIELRANVANLHFE